MTVALVCHIELPATANRDALIIKRVENVTIDSSWKNLTDKATITLPRIAPQWKEKKLRSFIRMGDPVIIKLGYNNMLEEEFRGYVVQVQETTNIEIVCEDEMWNLKKGKVSVSYKKVTLDKLLKDIVPGYQIDALPLELGQVRFSRLTPALILKEMREKAHINCFFRKGVLVGGKIHSDDSNTIEVDYERKVRSHNLQFKNNQDQIVKVIAESTLSNGGRLSVSVGDDGGQENKLAYFNITSKTKLKELAENDLRKIKTDGYEGTIDCFGRPIIYHGDKVKLISKRYPERDGVYYIDGVKVDFGQGGYKRALTLGGLAQTLALAA